MTKYAVRFESADCREDFLRLLGSEDPGARIDPEGNPVTVWIDTVLPLARVEAFDGVEHAVVSVMNEKARCPLSEGGAS